MDSKETQASEGGEATIKSNVLLEKLAEAFSHLDVNNDGQISKQEFISGVLKDSEIQSILHIPIEKTAGKSPPASSNDKARGSFSMKEKDVARRATRTRNLGIALKYFKKMDADNSGVIDINEFSSFFQSENLEKLIEDQIKKAIIKTENMSEEDSKMIKQLFDFLDSDESGLVSYVELCEGLGPTNANRMFTTMDVDGNKYLSLDEVLQSLDNKFKGVSEEDKDKFLGDLASSCLAYRKMNSKNNIARTKLVTSVSGVERKLIDGIQPAKQKQVKTDLLEAYADNVKPIASRQGSILNQYKAQPIEEVKE
mmetsp:Transcript_8751/g.16113  ORF Transcript_8751/g.16113 Transcript_8751/m.16113 type:complete len:311 (+) Transcript_8751:141-1073(+)|eukprot:CAMPEP_0197526504 /NCGR_PEP_ID=MMETSP1318-20131121/17960_1 /TAXON_ID=552666 /ORGANISM="Partenskyella glossopodia, Strain RCC365" /LENGTH=310 /DNA_ID=CAMNT_0043080679 /DNA_START=57 /DNA_END=989 /DNA_ORIENTATION=-